MPIVSKFKLRYCHLWAIIGHHRSYSSITSANRTTRKPCSSPAKQLSLSMTTARVGASSIEP